MPCQINLGTFVETKLMGKNCQENLNDMYKNLVIFCKEGKKQDGYQETQTEKCYWVIKVKEIKRNNIKY